MAITNGDGLIASIKRKVIYQKTGSRTTVAGYPFSIFDQAGNPGLGTLAVGNTANGIVPTDAIAGYPLLATASGTLYINRIYAKYSVAGWLDLYDCVFSCGAYAFGADTTLTSQPSFVTRMPNSDYNGNVLFLEAVTTFTGSQTIQINYLDQDGNAGDTGAIATGIAPIIGRMYEMPLAAGDSGVSQIVRIRSTVSSAGTFNVHVMRWLWGCRVNVANQGVMDSLLRTGLSQIYDTSALRVVVTTDGTSSGLPAIRCETVDG